MGVALVTIQFFTKSRERLSLSMTTLCDSHIKRADIRVGVYGGFMPSSLVDTDSMSPSRSALLCLAVAGKVHTSGMCPREYACIADNVHTRVNAIQAA